MHLRAAYLCLLKLVQVMILCASWVTSVSASEKVKFAIAASAMEDALTEFSKQANVGVVFLKDRVNGMRSRPVRGIYTREDALRRLISRNRLCFDFGDGGDSVTVDTCAKAHEEADGPNRTHSPKSQGANQTVASQLSGDLDGVTVTGTHIPRTKIVGPDPIVLTQADLSRYGIRTLADLSRVLPQFFGGGPSQDTHQIGTETQTNSGLGSAYNVRALGARATLVLINGRRLAPSGISGAFVDVTNIPLSAIDRIEILADGVSAIYGADSVAGVVNIIMRDSKAGDETSARFSAVTEGVWREGVLAQTLSRDWTTGGIFGSVEYSKNTALPERDRGFGNSDLRYFGGPNLGLPESWPPTLTVGSRTWAVAKGVTGEPSVAQLLPDSVHLSDAHSNSDLLPLQEGIRAYGRARQSFSDILTVTVEGMQTHRQGTQLNGGDREDIPVLPTSSYYLPAIGNGAPMVVERDLFNVLGPKTTHVDVQTSYGAATVEVPLGDDRRIELSASRALETEHQQTTGIADSAAVIDPTVNFNPFADRNSVGSMAPGAIQGMSLFGLASELHEYGAQFAGPIVSSKAGRMTGALGVEYRTQMLRTCDNVVPSGGCERYERRLKAAFLEVALPLFGAERTYTGLQSLELSAAGRYEGYSDFGHATTPRFGFRWAPVIGVEFKGSWGTSSRAPNLPDLNTSRNTVVTALVPSGIAEVIYRSGNNSGLKEERARTGTLETDYTRSVTENSTIRLGADFFDIHYFDRIQSVDFSAIGADLLTNPKYESLLLRNPSPATVAALCASRQLFGSQADCLAGNYAAVVDLRLRNIDTLLTRGLDFNGSWRTERPWGGVGFDLIGTYLLEYSDRATPSSPVERLLNTQNSPIDLVMHASAGLTYRDFGARVTVNFSNKYRDTASIPNRPIGSWTTIDLQLQYEPDRATDSVWQGVSVTLDVQNVADHNPPFLINRVERLGYDEENADPLNRVIEIRLRKRW
jgi:iron complex outermembrane recepter protein